MGESNSSNVPPGAPKAGWKLTIEDLFKNDLVRTFRRDFHDLYAFYLDRERREKLAAMGWLRRGIWLSAWLLKSMFLKLTPARQLLFILSVVFFFTPQITWDQGNLHFNVEARLLGFFIILLVLMLELKDKLLAKDELAVGRAVQMALLPDRAPEIPGWDVWLYTRPANDVGGDLVDYLDVGGGRTGLALGDVAGKGLGAALLMSKLQATLRALAPGARDLAGLGGQVNRIFCRDGLPNRFATLLYLELAAGGGGPVRLLNAGHLPPLAIRAAGVDTLAPVAAPLGVLIDETFTEQTIDLAPGELLLAYSDGLTEAHNIHNELYDDARLLALAPKLHGLSAEAAGRRLLADVDRFAGEARARDDLSLILIRRM
ncbi:MAG TPA: PP2C family protein-serine/threonine phosphatase [Acidobacteriota bacterium]|nr:PP2C family protein-serine/threonine phosphatase [Acidobacteriota bacterium]